MLFHFYLSLKKLKRHRIQCRWDAGFSCVPLCPLCPFAPLMLERPTRRGKPPLSTRRATDLLPGSRAARRRELRAARDKRHRDRVKAGKIVVGVELGGEELSWLISVRWITPGEADQGDGRAIGAAIAAGLARSARG